MRPIIVLRNAERNAVMFCIPPPPLPSTDAVLSPRQAFQRTPKGARCMLLNKDGAPCPHLVLHSKGGPTTPLWKHVQRRHPEAFVALKRGNQPTLGTVMADAQRRIMPKASQRECNVLADLWTHWVAKNGRPANIGEDAELRAILRLVSGGKYEPPSRDTVSARLPIVADRAQAEMRRRVALALGAGSTLHVCLDGWSCAHVNLVVILA